MGIEKPHQPSPEEMKKEKKDIPQEKIEVIKKKFEEMLTDEAKVEEFYELVKDLPIIFTERNYHNIDRDSKSIDLSVEGGKIILKGYKYIPYINLSGGGTSPKTYKGEKEIDFQPFVNYLRTWEGNQSYNNKRRKLDFYLSSDEKDKLTIEWYEPYQDVEDYVEKNLQERSEWLDELESRVGTDNEEFQKELSEYIKYSDEQEKIAESHVEEKKRKLEIIRVAISPWLATWVLVGKFENLRFSR